MTHGTGIKSLVQEVARHNAVELDGQQAGVHSVMSRPYEGPERRNPELAVGRPLYIADLDGTISNPGHREHFLHKTEPPDWRGFFAACVNDLPVHPVITTVQVLKSAGAEVWIWTGRSDEVADVTKEWLYLHRVPYHQMRMRPEENHASNTTLKAAWFAEMAPHDKERLVAVLEDDPKVLMMWRRLGVPCFQVGLGLTT